MTEMKASKLSPAMKVTHFTNIIIMQKIVVYDEMENSDWFLERSELCLIS